jgi:2'-hydroxyisoflavone reductase
LHRRILIIGGTGFIGAAVCEDFLYSGDEVTLFHRELKKGTREHLNLVHIIGDRNDPPEELKSMTFDIVIDTCGYSPNDFRILNFLKFEHYIFISSVAVFSNQISPLSSESGSKIDEDHLDLSGDLRNVNKHQRYGISKLECERYLRINSDCISVIRPSIVLGKNEKTGRLRDIYQLPKTNARIPMETERKFQFIDINDLVNLISGVAERMPGDDYNLVGPSLDWQEFVSTFCKVFEIVDYLPVNNLTDFPFWDNYPNSGIRSLVSKHSWIAKHKFISLADSLMMYKSNLEQI